MDLVDVLESEQIKKELPNFKVGDTVKVHLKIAEGGRERIQVFEGIVIKRANKGIRENFTVRKISHGVGVEQTLLTHSPKLEGVEIVKRGRVRRARLYYLRKRIGKASGVKGAKK